MFEGLKIDCAYRADLIVEGSLVLEVKALDTITPVHKRQVNTYTKLAQCPVGLLLNFGAILMKDGIYRVVNNFPGSNAQTSLPSANSA